MSQSMQSEDVVAWCPSYSEVLERWRPGYWRETMTRFLDHVAPSVTVVLAEVPAIESEEFDTRHLNTLIRRINHARTVSAHSRSNVAIYTPPAVWFILGCNSLYDSAYYEAIGSAVAGIVLAKRFGTGVGDRDVPAATDARSLEGDRALV